MKQSEKPDTSRLNDVNVLYMHQIHSWCQSANTKHHYQFNDKPAFFCTSGSTGVFYSHWNRNAHSLMESSRFSHTSQYLFKYLLVNAFQRPDSVSWKSAGCRTHLIPRSWFGFLGQPCLPSLYLVPGLSGKVIHWLVYWLPTASHCIDKIRIRNAATVSRRIRMRGAPRTGLIAAVVGPLSINAFQQRTFITYMFVSVGSQHLWACISSSDERSSTTLTHD